MGSKKLAIAKPTIIQTELRPLDESFWIDQNNQLEQWYYQNTGDYSPDRQITPLQLTPMLSCKDADTGIVYTPSFVSDASGVQWFVKEWNGSAYAERQITSQTATDFYYLNGNVLVVQKNNPDASHAVNVRVKAKYIDPRDESITRTVEASVILPTSVDATQVFPTLDILEPSSRPFNPLKDDPIYKFHATSNWNGVAQRSASVTDYACDSLGTEEILPTNEDMVVSSSPILQLDYPSIKKNNQQFTYRQTANGQGSGNGMANVKNLKGNTIAWNQTLPFGNTTYENWIAIYGTKAVLNNVVNFTITNRHMAARIECTDITFVVGHKYYLCGFMKPSKDTVGKFYVTAFTPEVACSANVWTKVSAISTVGSSTIEYGFYCDNHNLYLEANDTVQFKQIMRIDLTLMFGAGNEPHTVAEFESWLATNIVLKDYYEYCSGKLVGFGGTPVKMNQILPNGNFEDGATKWSLASASYVVKNKEITIVVNETSSVKAQIYQNVPAVTGHIYLQSFFAKASTSGTIVNRVNSSYEHFNVSTTYARSTRLYTLASGSTIECNAQNSNLANGQTFTIKNFILIDLTTMFGAGNEPDLAWCDAHFTADYYPYHTGYETNLLNITGQKTGLKSVGFNLWDEEWESGMLDVSTGGNASNSSRGRSKNYVKISPSTQYYIKSPAITGICFYDSSKNYLGYSTYTETGASGGAFTSPSNASYLRFYYESSSYGNNVCISLSSSKNGTYEAHKEAISDMSWVRTLGIENFNLFDEIVELGDITAGLPDPSSSRLRSKNYCPCEPSTTYYIKGVSGGNIWWYNSNKTYISYSSIGSNDSTSASPSNAAYFKINLPTTYGTTYNYDICINKSISYFNGRYVPYGETALYFPNGLCGTNGVYDEVYIEDGKIKGAVKFRSIRLRDLGFVRYISNGNEYEFETTNIQGRKLNNNIICNKYYNIGNAVPDADMYLYPFGMCSGSSATVVKFFDPNNSTNTVDGFKNSNADVQLIYELATPYEFEIDIPRGLYKWFGIDGSGNETEIQNTPAYTYAPQDAGKGQDTDCISVNALYGESLPVILRVRSNNWGNPLLPLKVTKSVSWKIPPIDVVVVSDKGSAVRASHISSSANFIFSTIVNQQGTVISDEVKEAQMAFNWFYTKYGASTIAPVSLGLGLTKSVAASTLRNATAAEGGTSATTGVNCDAYVWGAYELVSGSYVRRIQLDDGTWVTKAD